MKKKDWNEREKRIFQKLKAKRQPASGALWTHKEDGASEHILYQLKSTTSASIRVNIEDIIHLTQHAAVEHKIPCFLLDFIDYHALLFCVQLQDISHIASALKEECVIIEKEKNNTE